MPGEDHITSRLQSSARDAKPQLSGERFRRSAYRVSSIALGVVGAAGFALAPFVAIRHRDGALGLIDSVIGVALVALAIARLREAE